MEKSIMKQKRKLGFSLGLYLIMANALGFLFAFIIGKTGIINEKNQSWITLIINALSLYVFSFLGIKLLLRKVENVEERPKTKLGVKKMFFFIFVAMGVGYLCSIITNNVVTMIDSMLNIEIVNRVSDMMEDTNPIAMVIFVAILGPIFEELIFRGTLLKKLRVYGDKTAIVYTGIAFGLFHTNIAQLVYTAILGFILAYVVVKTNDIKYSIILHIVVNSVATVAAILVQYKLEGIIMLYSILIFVLVISAAIVLPIKASKNRIEISNNSKYDKSKLYKNAGYIFSVIIVVIITVVSSINI